MYIDPLYKSYKCISKTYKYCRRENGATICTPNCKIDPHCQENEYCDFSEGGEGNCVEGCRNGAACGNNVQPCGTCENHICVGEPECCTNADCQVRPECCADSECPEVRFI